jgi:beta-glucosidase/6-phospho-beta-glucosidase/beta-galactosidase
MHVPEARMYRNATSPEFMFATGIENSYPTIQIHGHKVRVDEMEKTKHYENWRQDFALTRELGLRYLRYGPPYYRVHLRPGKYDWGFVDETFNELRRLRITPIVDLCHFGVPDWIGGFQNEDWPEHFAEYAGAFAHRFPWVRFYTPVNEIFIAARFSARLGMWNERKKSDQAFVTALTNCVRASVLAEEAILRVRPEALFIQSEASSYFHYENIAAMERAAFLNQQRFLALDLLYGIDTCGHMHAYLRDNDVTEREYDWFMEHGAAIRPYCIMGNDYYGANEHWVPPGNAQLEGSGPILGYYVITHHYYERYRLPIMHTETNQRQSDEPERWLRKQWANIVALKHDDVPLIGFTWYSLIDQVDWDSALTQNAGHVDKVGLAGLDRKLHDVGRAYKTLIAHWREVLPVNRYAVDITREDQRLPGARLLRHPRALGRDNGFEFKEVDERILNVEEHARPPEQLAEDPQQKKKRARRRSRARTRK